MLLQYDIENNLSIKERQRVSFVADKKKENIECTIGTAGFDVVPVVAIYGKNASGKTNVLKGLKHIFDMVTMSPIFDPFEGIPFYHPFKFSNKKNEDSKFEITFTIKEKRYTYGFSHNNKEITEEYLYVFNTQKPTKIFDKEVGDESYTFGTNYGDLEEYVEKTHNNKLLLSTIAHWAANQSEITAIYEFFKNGMLYYQKDCGIPAFEFEKATSKLLIEDEKAREFLKLLIKYLDMEIVDIEVKNIEVNIENAPEEVRDFIKFIKKEQPNFTATDVKTVYNIAGEKYSLDLDAESNGIQKIYQIFPLLYHGLTGKKIIVIDEIETGLHPLIVKAIIKLFQNREINKYNSQLIFTTHLPTVLDLQLLRRDEIWFAERTLERGYSTELYSLADVTGVRTTDNIEREYLQGKYNRIPSKNTWIDVRG